MNDHRLVRQAQSGDTAAFGELYDLTYDQLLAFLLHKTSGDMALSEDILSETFFKALKFLDSFKSQPDKPVITWLYRIADNELKMYWRKNMKYHFETLEDHPELRTNHADGFDHAVAAEQRALVATVLAQLSDDDRQLIHWHYFEYRPLGDIALQLGVRVGTMKVRLHRARKKLHSLLSQSPSPHL